ncbi:hypothetical protein [Paenibacillus sp. GCM10027626]|uniref:hypothetical protein n=1 Tax=Paenibacillus sp. GCM10027626 TaxID=3273411 RepID=UPI00363909AF
MRYTAIILSALGALLLVWSAQPLLLMWQEMSTGDRVRQELQIDRIYANDVWNQVSILGDGPTIPVPNMTVTNTILSGGKSLDLHTMEDYYKILSQSGETALQYAREYTWEGNTIRVQDEIEPGLHQQDSRQTASLSITINDADWSAASSVDVRPYFLDENRYHGYFGMLAVKEKGVEKLLLIQRVTGTDPDFVKEKELGWRILTIEKNGSVQEDIFAYEDRAAIPKRVNFVNLSSTSPISLGYRSNILQGWPNLFFPLLYPWTSGLVGLLLLITGGTWGLVKLRMKRRVKRC